MIDNHGRTALVFGIRDDLSLAWATAKALARSGCRVACSYMPETKEAVLRLLADNGMDPELTGCVDVRDEASISGFVAAMQRHLGAFDYVLHAVAHGSHRVICAKPPGAPDEAKPRYLDIPFDDLVASFDISAYSLLRICRVAEPHLRDGASIVTLTYQAAQRVFAGYAGMAINKAALENIAIYLAEYFGARGIRVNAVSAGMVMSTSAAGLSGVRALRKATRAGSPLGNITAEDVADACLYYFSDLSRRVTGNIHFVDGGYNKMGITVYER